MSGREEHLQSEEDLEAILRLAVRREGESSADLRARLVQSANELGVSPEALEEAERVYREQRKAELARADEEAEFREFRKSEWMGFVHHLIPYLIVNMLLIALDWLQSPELRWSLGPLFGWGIGLAFHFFFTLFPGDQSKDFRKWKQRRAKARA
ncbi:MAG: 2TM domain-containing protein [Fimbriimonadaceae bacterium]|nr:2TM domain-containing protein [Fimbriimonadaceae bacterium]QYK58197.1 MAG: 2TM domain-containing protein [Fimbriimonadaceae bacterium]